VEDADLLLHVIDASANWEEQVDSVNEVLQQLEDRRGDIVLVFNKTDRLTHEEEAGLRARTELLGPRVFSSAHEPEGLDDLRTELRRRIQATRPTVRVSFSSSDGRTLAEAYREGEVLERLDDGGTIVLTARVPEALLGRWTAQDGIEVVRQDAA
jgi:50S ribosomal subunit-associated GTPase HflX